MSRFGQLRIWGRKKPKRVLIAIHGFGHRKQADFEYLKQALSTERELEYRCFDLYDEDKEEKEWLLWVARANQEVTRYIESGYQVILLGFSMGGVIAAFLASFLPVSKLILVAPAFEYLNLETVTRLINKTAAILKKSETEFKDYLAERMLAYEYFPQFFDLVKKLKPAIAKVECPLLILQGLQDEFVPLTASRYAYEKAKSERKQMIVFEQSGHELLENKHCRQDAFMLIRMFIDDRWGGLKEPAENPGRAVPRKKEAVADSSVQKSESVSPAEKNKKEKSVVEGNSDNVEVKPK